MLLNSAQLRAVAIARLENVTSSTFDEPLRSASVVMLTAHRRGLKAGAPDFEMARDALADAVAALPGSLAFHLDLMRVLRGEAAQIVGHRRRNAGAALRDLRRRLGRAPVEADFPAGHPVRLFAVIYWGGIAAWAGGAGARMQRPKGYWGNRSHQITALRAAASQHPHTPVTHALLCRSGLHRLGQALDAVQLAALAAEAGISRRLTYRLGGFWTANQAIDSYAALCRKSGVTLSTPALLSLGGEASSLRIYARRFFYTFAAFQTAVVARYPDIRPPNRPTARDGLLLDSWSEVVVYNALRTALPDHAVAVHVLLPGERSRSADFVVGGFVHVEVVGIAPAEMPTVTSKRQQKYAAQWAAKQARYAALGVVPIVVEPADLHDSQRLAGRIAEVAQRLGCVPPPVPPPSTGRTRSKGTWTFEALCQAVEQVAAGSGVLPTHAALTAAGCGHAAGLLKRPGHRARVAQVLGLADPHRRGQWDRDRVVADLSAWVSAHGRWPTNADLLRAGRGALRSARDRLWRSDMAALRAAVAQVTGQAVTRRRAPNGSLTTPAQIADALRPLARRLGRMPTAREAAAAGLGTAWTRASRTMGVDAMAARIGVPGHMPRRRSRAEMMAAFVRLSISLEGATLTTRAVRAALGSGGIAWVRKCGGIEAVRAELGRRGVGGGQGG